MATTVASSFQESHLTKWSVAVHLFKMSDNALVVIHWDHGSTYRTISTDNGATWGTPSAVYGSGGNAGMAVCQVGDTLYGAYTRAGADFIAFKMVYASGSFTDSSAAIVQSPGGLGNINDSPSIEVAWDSVNGCMHVGLSWYASGTNADSDIYAVSSSLTKIAQRGARFDANGVEGGYRMLIDTASPPNIYWFVGSHTTGTIAFYMYGYTFNGSAYSVFPTFPEVVDGVEPSSVAAVFDTDGTIDLVYQWANVLYTRKRTGANTYGAVTTLVSTNVVQWSLGVTANANIPGDLLVMYSNTTNQAAGELYLLTRHYGIWTLGPGTLFAGGAGGWVYPSFIARNFEARARLLYVTSNNPWLLKYETLAVDTMTPQILAID